MRLKYLFLAFCARSSRTSINGVCVLLILFNNIILARTHANVTGVGFNIIFIVVHAIVLLLCTRVCIYIYTFLRETTLGGGFSGAAPPRCVGKPNRSSSGIARS